jgi:hypothetical protein
LKFEFSPESVFTTPQFLGNLQTGPISYRLFHYTKLKRLARDEEPSLSGPFISYEENEVLVKIVPGAEQQVDSILWFQDQ